MLEVPQTPVASPQGLYPVAILPPETHPSASGVAGIESHLTMTPSIGDVCNSVEATIDDPVERSSLVWGIPFASLTMQESVDRIEQLLQRRLPSYVITANLNYVMLHHELAEMAAVTRDAALVLADGQPIVWRSRLSSRPLRERVAGSELIFRLAERARDRGWGIYFLGGEPGVAQACASRLALAYPGLRIAGVESPPFRELSDEEQSLQDARIIASGADLLLVAFGQPKGEKWIHRNYRRLKVPVAIQLGASFDFIAGRSKRAPRIWQLVGMEWAYRMSSDPRRLAPRYWANAKFLFKALLKDMRPSSRSLSIAEASRNRSQR